MKTSIRIKTRPSVLLLTLASSLLLLSTETQAQKPDRSAPPKLGPPPSLSLKPIQHLKLSNGLPVVLLEKHEVPLVQVNLVLKSGAVMDPEKKGGLASMTAAMLTEGAGGRNALELADAIDYLGANLNAAAGQHTTGIDLHTPLTKLDSALALMADVTLRPTFPSAELERKRTERLTVLVQWRDEPRAIASVMFNRTLFGTHPYGRTTLGDESALRSFSVDDLRKFHASQYTPDKATLIVVGDVTAATVLPKLEKAFGLWKVASTPAPQLPAIQQVAGRKIYLVDKPGAPQSEIRIGRIGVPRLTDDYFPIVVMNTILGGSFASRINQNLRETHGYTYGASSRFDFRPLAGPFLASSAVQTAVTDSALVEFMKELHAILQPVSDTELERAKNYVSLSFPGEFQTVAQIAGQLEELVVYGLPDDYFNKYIGRIQAVTKDDVQRVAKKYIDPAAVAIIVVGDRAVVEPGLKALDLGPITNLSIEDVLGKAPSLGR